MLLLLQGELETNGFEEQSQNRHLCGSEVEAYEIGRAGLWDIAVPVPLFVALDDKKCALCLTAGSRMPLDPEELSYVYNGLRQALWRVSVSLRKLESS